MSMTTRLCGMLIGLTLALSRSATAQTADERARAAFGGDVHASAGLTCEACHGGGVPRSTAVSAAASYAIRRTAIAPLCARCHSDAAYMRKFVPQLRIDQYAEYVTSTHGKRMAAGEARAATCSDCHGAHGVRPVKDARSPVAPQNVADTCARCHGDPVLMQTFDREATPPKDWSAGVHAAALLKRGDASAPTCSTCHGSHGATPPGVTQVANVCGQCHVREAELFRTSPKKAIFDGMDQAECLVCHSNHRIESPLDAWIGLTEGALCAQCHDETTESAKTIVEMRRDLDRLNASIATADGVLSQAVSAGMLVDEGGAALREAREHLVHSRVLVHAFAAKPLTDITAQGVTAADRARAMGQEALRELQIRRRGLVVATFLILGFLVTLWWKIRQLPRTEP